MAINFPTSPTDGQFYQTPTNLLYQYNAAYQYWKYLPTGVLINTAADNAGGIANGAFVTANAAFGQANTAYYIGNVAFAQANGAYWVANAAFGKANTPGNVAVLNVASIVAKYVHLEATDDTNEGAEIVWYGANSHSTWITDIFAEQFRMFNQSANSTTLNIFSTGNTVSLMLNGTYIGLPPGFGPALNLQINATVGSNALTVALKASNGTDPTTTNPIQIPFRNVTVASGDPVWRSVTAALSVVVPSGQAMGTVNGTPFRFWIVAIDNDGTVELGLINCLVGGATPTAIIPINESALASTTAIASAPSAGIFYSTTARSAKAIRILGYVEYATGLGTAGTYSAAPTIVQLFGPGIKKPGDTVQTSMTRSTAYGAGSGTIPDDDTIPQSSEGNEFMTVSITPTSNTSLLVIEASARLYCGTTGEMWVILCQDSKANSLSAMGDEFTAAVHTRGPISIEHTMLANTTASTTFKLRAGLHTAATTAINGEAGSRKMGGVMGSNMIVTETSA